MCVLNLHMVLRLAGLTLGTLSVLAGCRAGASGGVQTGAGRML